MYIYIYIYIQSLQLLYYYFYGEIFLIFKLSVFELIDNIIVVLQPFNYQKNGRSLIVVTRIGYTSCYFLRAYKIITSIISHVDLIRFVHILQVIEDKTLVIKYGAHLAEHFKTVNDLKTAEKLYIECGMHKEAIQLYLETGMCTSGHRCKCVQYG